VTAGVQQVPYDQVCSVPSDARIRAYDQRIAELEARLAVQDSPAWAREHYACALQEWRWLRDEYIRLRHYELQRRQQQPPGPDDPVGLFVRLRNDISRIAFRRDPSHEKLLVQLWKVELPEGPQQ